MYKATDPRNYLMCCCARWYLRPCAFCTGCKVSNQHLFNKIVGAGNNNASLKYVHQSWCQQCVWVLKWVKGMPQLPICLCVRPPTESMKYEWQEASTLPSLRATSPTVPTSVYDHLSPTFSYYMHQELLPLLTQLSNSHQAESRLPWQHPKF